MSGLTTALYCPMCGTIYAMELINPEEVEKDTFATKNNCDFCGDVPLLFLCFMPGVFRMRNYSGGEKNFD